MKFKEKLKYKSNRALVLGTVIFGVFIILAVIQLLLAYKGETPWWMAIIITIFAILFPIVFWLWIHRPYMRCEKMTNRFLDGYIFSEKEDMELLNLTPSIQKQMKERTGKHVEVMIYGDGAFKDPVGKIWELADPVVAPAYTAGLEGQPNEVKLKYLADNDFANLSGAELKEAIAESIRSKEDNLVGKMASQGTTPRQLTDLIGSLCDLTSGSGDKGTPIILIQGYIDNFTTE